MSKPKIVERRGVKVTLEPGTYKWCSCGESPEQPFCDGKSCAEGFEPVTFEVDEVRNYRLCNCKHTGHPPFCDGKHWTI